MTLYDEKYKKSFVFLNCRFDDRKWFFCKFVMQYYCRSQDRMGHITPWIKIDGKFYTEEELLIRKLSGDKIYLKKQD